MDFSKDKSEPIIETVEKGDFSKPTDEIIEMEEEEKS